MARGSFGTVPPRAQKKMTHRKPPDGHALSAQRAATQM
jgi:hypothetical protein